MSLRNAPGAPVAVTHLPVQQGPALHLGRVGEVRDCVVELAFAGVRETQPQLREAVVWSKPRHQGVLRDRLVVSAADAVQPAQDKVWKQRRWIELERAFDFGDGRFEPATAGELDSIRDMPDRIVMVELDGLVELLFTGRPVPFE